MKTLRQAKCGETLTIRRLEGEGTLKHRIMDMGPARGAPVYICKVAPLGLAVL